MSTACSILFPVINLLVTSMSGAGLADVCEHGGTAVFSRLLRWANGDSSDKWGNVARPTETTLLQTPNRVATNTSFLLL